jgi:uncharacterized protein YjiS (DUF1127 family)
MTAIHLQPCENCPEAGSRPLARDWLSGAARRAISTLRLWRWRVRGRNELARLDERLLKDIGLTPADREFLVNKPFWRE